MVQTANILPGRRLLAGTAIGALALAGMLCAPVLRADQSPDAPGPAYDLDRPQLEAVLADLRAWLPGAWDSYPQIWYERNVRMPEDGEHEHWHRTFALIDAPQVGDTVFYGQINIGGRSGPLMARSQVLYKAVIDEERGVVSINGQGPREPERFVDLHDRPELWGEVQMRDESAIRCDFIWRRDGNQIFGVLEGKTPERRKYGPGTCTYLSDSGAEFYADAEWVLTPDELWLYDINKIRGAQFIGRKDRTHIRLYRARSYACVVTGGISAQEFPDAHDRGFGGALNEARDSGLRWQLLRAWYPSGEASGLVDETRLTLSDAGSGQVISSSSHAPGAETVSLEAEGWTVDCRLLESG